LPERDGTVELGEGSVVVEPPPGLVVVDDDVVEVGDTVVEDVAATWSGAWEVESPATTCTGRTTGSAPTVALSAWAGRARSARPGSTRVPRPGTPERADATMPT
jgi:hypothetical protein